MADTLNLRDDLRGLLRGDVLFDDITRTLYSTDASIFEIRPLGVVAPHDEEDIHALVRYAVEHGVALIPRGAGTGLAGESLGAGLVVDLARHLRQVVEVGADFVRVQPGVTLRNLSAVLAAQGRRFAPDPANPECTVGGMLATNASGPRSLRFGYTRDHIDALRLVLDTGEIVSVGRHPCHPPAPQDTVEIRNVSPRLEDIVSSLVTLLGQNAALVREHQPRTRFNRCGYLLHDVLTSDHLDLARLLVGSEGTLGLFTEATLRTVPLPGGQAAVLAGFGSLDAGLQAARAALDADPVACELLDRRLLSLARTAAALPLPSFTESLLLVELEADSPAAVAEQAQRLADPLQRLQVPALFARAAAEPDEVEQARRVRESILPALYALRGGAQAVTLIEDVAVPTDRLTAYLDGVQKLLNQHETTASFLIHAATGQVHARPFLDLRRPRHVNRLIDLADAVHALALELGGTVSSRHGTGLARTRWLSRQYGPLYSVMRDVKAVFDPRNLFNPGKIVALAGAPAAYPLRPASGGEAAEPAAILPHPAVEAATRHLSWDGVDPQAESERCNGCGHCRTDAPAARMCPLFRATHAEEATPRAKANLLRQLLRDPAGPHDLSSDEVRAVADLCVNCKMCASECPAHVAIPKLMLETKAANVARHGLDRGDWVLARTETFARLGSALAPVANALLRNRPLRWLLEKLFGVSRRRRLPAFAWHSFLYRAARRGWTRPPSGRGRGPRVAYFVDVFANYNDPSIAEAAVGVLHYNDIEVFVPPGQRGCGMAPLAYGDAETARDTVLRNQQVLAELARDGYTIVCSEPTAALMLRHDALDLLEGTEERKDAELVARQTVEWTTFVWELFQEGRLRTDFRRLDLSVGHHVPCHLKALGGPPRGPALLALIPGLHVRTIDVSCSGMAGTFGLKAANYDVSLEAGRPMLDELGRPGVLLGSTECSTCRLQMEDGALRRTLHPAQYLALAYGLMPELAARLRRPIRERVLE